MVKASPDVDTVTGVAAPPCIPASTHQVIPVCVVTTLNRATDADAVVSCLMRNGVTLPSLASLCLGGGRPSNHAPISHVRYPNKSVAKPPTTSQTRPHDER